jgi:hypothetical protein
MSYPVFVTDRESVVDFKNGVWEKGKYTGRPFRFVNFPALNHHSVYCGMTSAEELSWGDLSTGGPDPHQGKLTRILQLPLLSVRQVGSRAARDGAEVGVPEIRGRRTEYYVHGMGGCRASNSGRTGGLASTDPVALDYHSGKYLLFPNSKLAILIRTMRKAH